ncbi:MAG: hypothetical protein L0221_14650, partial [Chloroflexi bacterium]|nr:hypothetical protein [Chloroflexota bacterium]
VCYDREPRNIERLAAALDELGARLRGAPDDVPFLLDAKTLTAGMNFTFTTTHGPLDVLGQPSGDLAYRDLAEHASTVDLGNLLVVQVCDLDDLIEMKLAAGRRKDLIEVEVLSAVRSELEERGDR